MNCPPPPDGREQCQVTQLASPIISETDKAIDTSNSICRWTVASASQQKINWLLKGRAGKGQVTHFLNLLPSPIVERMKTDM